MTSEYSLVSTSGQESIPLVCYDGASPISAHSKTLVENPELVTYRFAEPIPRKPILADYHEEFQPAVSKKIFDVLNPLNINGIQLISAVIRDKKRILEYTDYWQLLIYKRIVCVNLEKSICRSEIDFGEVEISKVEKLVLDEKILSEVPLNERLIFRLNEMVTYKVFHNSIVEKIMATNPTGLFFVPVEEWNYSTAYF